MVSVSPAEVGGLCAEPDRLVSPVSARMTTALNGPRPEAEAHLDLRVGLSTLRQFPVEPVDRSLHGVDDGQVVLDHFTRGGEQWERGEPFTARTRPASAPGRPLRVI